MNFSFFCQLFFLQVLFSTCGAKVTISKGSIKLKNSEILDGNLLPGFYFQQGEAEGVATTTIIGGGRGEKLPFYPDDSCADDIFEGASEDLRSPQLPYLTQDLWTCDRTVTDIETIEVESDSMVASIIPQWGGRIWRLYDKINKRDMVYDNPAHQPANIATLKGWSAGGIEWNWSPGIIGHSVFSESPVWVGILDVNQNTTKHFPFETQGEGKVIRVYEFDRYNHTTWQVDILMTDDGLWVHPKITNPTSNDLRGYWWTCVAVNGSPDIRILTPAQGVVESSSATNVGSDIGIFREADWPSFAMGNLNASFKGYKDEIPTDNSYLGNIIAGDFFVRINEPQLPYIGHMENDGYSVIHGHELNGTKFFTWGQNGPGRFWQDFLSGNAPDRQGDYCELQVGVAPTQFQTFSLPKKSTHEWTEWFKVMKGDVKVLSSPNYDEAMQYVENWFQTASSSHDHIQKEIEQMDNFFKGIADRKPDEILYEGMPWGALHEKLHGVKLAPGLEFKLPQENSPYYAEVQPWLELIDNGKFSDATLEKTPLSYSTDPAMIELIQKSGDSFGWTWLHHLHMGTYETERGNIASPLEHFTKSSNVPNPLATRNIGILQSSSEQTIPYLMQAWELACDLSNDYKVTAKDRLLRNLASELGMFLIEDLPASEDKLRNFLKSVHENDNENIGLVNLDNIVYAKARLALLSGENDPSKAIKILSSNCFPTYGRNRVDLISSWYTAQEMLMSEKLGVPSLTNVQAHQVRVKNPPPRNIGCAYGDTYCSSYW